MDSGKNEYNEHGGLKYKEVFEYGGVLSKQYIYDDYSQPVKMKKYDYEGTLEYIEEYDYDAHGHQTLLRNISRDNLTVNKIQSTYDGQGNLIYRRNTINQTTQRFEYDDQNRIVHDENVIQNGFDQNYYYDDMGNLVRKEVCSSNGSIVQHDEQNFDINGNLLSFERYDKNGNITSYSRNEYDSNGLIIERIYSVTSYSDQFSEGVLAEKRASFTYDKYGNLTGVYYYNPEGELEENVTYKYVSMNLGEQDVKNPVEIETANLYSFILCEGSDGYMLVAKWNETLQNVYYEVGVLDRDYNWVVPLSSDNTLSRVLATRGRDNYGEVRYCGEGVFLYECNYIVTSYEMLIVATGEWVQIDRINIVEPLKFCDGYLVVGKSGGYHLDCDSVLIVNSSGGTTEVEIPVMYTKSNRGSSYQLGRFSEGLFYARDGFYDSHGKMIIDLSDYTGQIINQPYFVDGQAFLVARSDAWTEYEAVIDINGNFIQEFTQR